MLDLKIQRQALKPSHRSILDTIGNTPLLRLSAIAADLPESVELWAKAEWFNPGGSVKDRPALRMVEHAEEQGLLVPGKTIIDSTSGNTGVAYAMIGAAKGYPVTLVMPANVSAERKAIVHAYGATLIESDPLEGSDGAIRLVRQIVAEDPQRYYYPDQYSNPANWIAHYETTGPEILAQTAGRVTHFVAGLGTTGTVMGVGRRLKHDKPGVQIVGVGPADELEVIEGLKHLATAIVPRIYDPAVVDREVPVAANEAWAMTRRLARDEGLFVGFSAGAAAHAALQVARELTEGVVVTLLPDGGSKYLSLGLWK
ncbi:MAG: cysteine synthase family protein [Anaerolineae bacterium]